MTKYFGLLVVLFFPLILFQSCDQIVEGNFKKEPVKGVILIKMLDVKLIPDRGIEVKYEIANPYNEEFCFPIDLRKQMVSAGLGIHISNNSEKYDLVQSQGLLISERGNSKLGVGEKVELTNVRYSYPFRYQYLGDRKVQIYFDGGPCKDEGITRYYSNWFKVSDN